MFKPFTKTQAVGTTNSVDRFGRALSMLCIAHCATVPFIAAILPLFEGSQIESLMHVGFLVLAGPVAFFAMSRALVRGNVRAFAMLLGGLLFVFGGHVLPVEHSFEFVFSIGGGVLLIAGHTVNCRCESGACATEGLSKIAKQTTLGAIETSQTMSWARTASHQLVEGVRTPTVVFTTGRQLTGSKRTR